MVEQEAGEGAGHFGHLGWVEGHSGDPREGRWHSRRHLPSLANTLMAKDDSQCNDYYHKRGKTIRVSRDWLNGIQVLGKEKK